MIIKNTILLLAIVSLCTLSCNQTADKVENIAPMDVVIVQTPKEMLTEAYQLFKEGDDENSIAMATKVLEIGKVTKNDTLIGRALTSLCRNSQRKQDTVRLAELSEQLANLSASSGDKIWLMYRAHMNAEMWRLIGDMNRAEAFYNESLEISLALNAMGMYTIDHFNKSFVATAKGNYEEAAGLIAKYYALRAEQNMPEDDAYGLIALAYLLEQKQNYKGAHEVAMVARRLFKDQNLFPEPPDEKPLLAVEAKVAEVLAPEDLQVINNEAMHQTVTKLLEKYL